MQTTTANRRDSLLELFDPLAGPRTPPRSAGSESPDSSLGSSSDKENDSPTPACGPVTEFFMRVYKDPKRTSLEQPQSPPGRLIDLSMSLEDEEDVGDKENGEQMEGVEILDGVSRADDSTAAYLEEMRMPLAELQLEKLLPSLDEAQTAMDVDPETSSPAQASNSPHTDPSQSPPSTTTAPFGTPFADVINSINHRDSPSINICAPDEDMVFEPEYVSPFAPRNGNPPAPRDSHLSPDASPTFPASSSTLRRDINTSSTDPRRISCDLQTSFSLVMQSTEMSFDLLNDKVSFFGQGQQHDQSWPGEHEGGAPDFSSDASKQSVGASTDMMEAADTSMEDDTFDFAKEKQKMDALDEKYGTIHQEQLKTVEKAAEAAIANSPKQRGSNPFPLPRFTLSPRPSPLREELLGAKNESMLDEPRVEPMRIPNIFAQHPKNSSQESHEEVHEPTQVPQAAQPRRSSIAIPTPLSRRKSIPALLVTKTVMKAGRERTPSSTSTASSGDTTRPASRTSLSRRGSVSSNKAAADNERSTSTSRTTTSVSRRGSFSALKVASLGRSSTKTLPKPDLEGATSSATVEKPNSSINRRGSMYGLRAITDSTRSTPSANTTLARKSSAAGVKSSAAGKTSASSMSRPVQPVKGVQRPPVKSTGPSASAQLAPSARQKTASAAVRPVVSSTASSGTTQRSVASKVAAVGRSISSGLQRPAATAPSAATLTAGAVRAPARSSMSTSNSTSTGPSLRTGPPRLPSKLPGLTRSTSIGAKPRKT